MKLNITDTVLDKLGFSEYWDEHGTWGTRTLTFSDNTKLTIIEYEEQDADYYENGNLYIAHHFVFNGSLKQKPEKDGYYDLFFLSDLYKCIAELFPDNLEEFVNKCKDLYMFEYIKELV